MPHQHIPLSQDAALVSALAGTAMAFSSSADDQAERWLRALRLHGRVGAALQGLGVGEAPLESVADDQGAPVHGDPLGDDCVERVVARAEEVARERRVGSVGTAELLLALFDVYGARMERVLYLRGTTREELFERLTEVAAAAE